LYRILTRLSTGGFIEASSLPDLWPARLYILYRPIICFNLA
jgi:hypothetical protein